MRVARFVGRNRLQIHEGRGERRVAELVVLLVEAHLELPDLAGLDRTPKHPPHNRDGDGAGAPLDGPEADLVLAGRAVHHKLARRHPGANSEARANRRNPSASQDALPAVHGSPESGDDEVGGEALVVAGVNEVALGGAPLRPLCNRSCACRRLALAGAGSGVVGVRVVDEGVAVERAPPAEVEDVVAELVVGGEVERGCEGEQAKRDQHLLRGRSVAEGSRGSVIFGRS